MNPYFVTLSTATIEHFNKCMSKISIINFEKKLKPSFLIENPLAFKERFNQFHTCRLITNYTLFSSVLYYLNLAEGDVQNL